MDPRVVYIGNGSGIAGIPTRSLSDADIERYVTMLIEVDTDPVEFLINTGLYAPPITYYGGEIKMIEETED